MTNLELAQEIYFALEEKQFDLEPAGFIATIESVLNKDLQRIAALAAERDGLREALQPFVYLWRDISLDNQPDAAPMLVLYGAVIVAAHIKAARRALEPPST